MITALAIIGIILFLVGAAGIWLAMTTPIQLQPIPAIVALIGLTSILLATGGAVL